ncbi:hypothetical protein AAHA92_15229 [Salvia divinorum]|uniref:Uncharacterized protein n=1 Tax=Salvia divinorum TaxID=28513 RepID=A0ABD1HE33_SALDI
MFVVGCYISSVAVGKWAMLLRFNGTLLVWSVAGTCFQRACVEANGLNGAYKSVRDVRGNLISLNGFSGRICWISLQGYLDCGGWRWSSGWEFKVLANPIPLWLVKFFRLKHSVWCLP